MNKTEPDADNHDNCCHGRDDTSIVIVAGGRGDRLSPITDAIPKVLLPLGDGTVLDRLLTVIAETGITDVHLLLGRHGDLVDAYVRIRKFQDLGLRLTLYPGTDGLGTAGPLRVVRGRCGPWLIINGDVATDLSLSDVLRTHYDSRADMTVVGVRHKIRVPYGVLSLDSDNRVFSITEKPVIQKVVSAGINVVGPRARQRLDQGGRCDMTELIERCIVDELDIRAYVAQATWFDLGTASNYEAALLAVPSRVSLNGARDDY